jgi:hypothetical protein
MFSNGPLDFFYAAHNQMASTVLNMTFSYSQQALVCGCGEPALAPALQQPRQMPSRAHVEPLCDPRQRHRRLRTQFPG